jgi:hypothetical protein
LSTHLRLDLPSGYRQHRVRISLLYKWRLKTGQTDWIFLQHITLYDWGNGLQVAAEMGMAYLFTVTLKMQNRKI